MKNVTKKDTNGKLEVQITMVNCPISKTNKRIAVENFGDRIFSPIEISLSSLLTELTRIHILHHSSGFG